jgi:hypothetical protein
MKRFKVPLRVEQVAEAILTALRGAVPVGVTGLAVQGTGVEQLS